ncbi:Uncharacterized protein APZ42_005255, partial [Daphnia magna]
TISNQLQLLLNAPRGNIVPPNPPPPPPPPQLAPTAAIPTPRRRLDTSSLEKLHGDIPLVDFKTWRNRWDDFGRLNQLSTYPVEEQTAALRLSLDTTMQQTVEVALNFTPNNTTLPSEILDAIANHIRLKRNVALDRVAFEECHQSANETFDEFFIRLKRLAGTAELCIHCSDERLATRVMAGVRDGESRRKLLSLSPFPTLQQAVNLCRGEESARANERTLSGQSSVNALNARPRRQPLPPGTATCNTCGRSAHNKEEVCPAIGRKCHICNEADHFSPRCPKRPQSESTSREKSVRFKAKVPHIAVCNLQVTNGHRKTPIITLDLR